MRVLKLFTGWPAIIVLPLLLSACEASGWSVRAAAPPRTRLELARAYNALRQGATRMDVLAVLGPPDDVVTDDDPSRFAHYPGTETWCYGTNGHLTYPTLGRVQVYPDRRDFSVLKTWAQEGNEIPSALLPPEEELRALLRLLDETAGDIASPLAVIQAVNALVPLGSEEAIAVLREYARVGGPWRERSPMGIVAVLRVFFEVPDPPGFHELPLIGHLYPVPPDDLRRAPRYPVAIFDDIPFDLHTGVSLACCPDLFEMHLTRLAAACELRKAPLSPSPRPWDALEKLKSSPQWVYEDEKREEAHIQKQILSLVDSVYRCEKPDAYWKNPDEYVREHWQEITNEIAKLSIRWDPSKSVYTFTDGSTLPARPRASYRRCYWRPEGLEPFDGKLTLERIDELQVHLRFEINVEDLDRSPLVSRAFGKLTGREARRPKPVKLAVIDVEKPEPPLTTLDEALSDGSRGVVVGCTFRIPVGRAVRIVLTYEGEETTSPDLTP